MGTTTIQLLPGTTTFTIPADWNNTSNTVSCYGAGSDGGDGTYEPDSGFGGGGFGGAGGAFSQVSNLTYTAGTVVTVNIPFVGGNDSSFTEFGGPGDGSGGVCYADYGKSGGGAFGTAGAEGGQASNSLGSVVFSGGSGGSTSFEGGLTSGNGAGGAADICGDGTDGDDGLILGSISGNGGRGGCMPVTFFNGCDDHSGDNGGPGLNGSGGFYGGSGAGGGCAAIPGNEAGSGSDGGNYGAGGSGGGASDTENGTGGSGASGIIIVSYNSNVPPVPLCNCCTSCLLGFAILNSNAVTDDNFYVTFDGNTLPGTVDTTTCPGNGIFYGTLYLPSTVTGLPLLTNVIDGTTYALTIHYSSLLDNPANGVHTIDLASTSNNDCGNFGTVDVFLIGISSGKVYFSEFYSNNYAGASGVLANTFTFSTSCHVTGMNAVKPRLTNSVKPQTRKPCKCKQK